MFVASFCLFVVFVIILTCCFAVRDAAIKRSLHISVRGIEVLRTAVILALWAYL